MSYLHRTPNFPVYHREIPGPTEGPNLGHGFQSQCAGIDDLNLEKIINFGLFGSQKDLPSAGCPPKYL